MRHDNDSLNDPFITEGGKPARARGNPGLRDPSLRCPSLRDPSVRGFLFIFFYKYQHVSHYLTLKDSRWLL